MTNPQAGDAAPQRDAQPIDLAPIKAREAAASKGPWIVAGYDREDGERWVVFDGGRGEDSSVLQEQDAEFIAEARQDIPQLIAEIERLRAALAASRTPLDPPMLDSARTLAEAVLASKQNVGINLTSIAHRLLQQLAESPLVPVRASGAQEHDSVVLAAEAYALKVYESSGRKFDISELIALKTWFYAGARWRSTRPNADVDGPVSDAFSAAVRASGAPQKATADVERWRDFYSALSWMVNDYIGVCGISADFTEVDARLGYAHEGYHNARRILADNKPPMPERLRQFNDGTACLTGGNQHPDRCVCQEKERGPFAGTPHKHYDEPPYSCARCSCKAYEPALPASASPSDDGARPPQDEACPCFYTTPCDPQCTCVSPTSSRGCQRCCSYGSQAQRKARAEQLAAVPSPSAQAVTFGTTTVDGTATAAPGTPFNGIATIASGVGSVFDASTQPSPSVAQGARPTEC